MVIEDACQFAWSRLVHHRHRVQRETVVTWLARTAVHEAFKLLRRERCQLPLEVAIDLRRAGVAPTSWSNARAPRALAGLPERQQRLLWLHALGLSYAEIARREGCTLRTVERQLLRAKQRVKDADRPA